MNHDRQNVVKLHVEYEGRDPRVDPWRGDIIAFASVEFEVTEVRQQCGPTAASYIFGAAHIVPTHVKLSGRPRAMTIEEYRRWAAPAVVVRAAQPNDPEPHERRAGMLWHDRKACVQRWPWGEVSYVTGGHPSDNPARLTLSRNGESITFTGSREMLTPMSIQMMFAGLRAGANMDRERAAQFLGEHDGTIPLRPR